jgi:hypothetical protein
MPGSSRGRYARVVALILLLVGASLTLPAVASSHTAPSSGGVSALKTAFSPAPEGPGVTELAAVYNARLDLQAAFPDALSNFTNYSQLVNWAAGVATGQWSDGAYAVLAPFGYYYVLMATYDARPDLRAAFSHAFVNISNFTQLVSWAGGVISGVSPDPAYTSMAPYGYWYALMSVYNSRSDLQSAYPNAYTNSTSFGGLVSWANGVVSGAWPDGAFSTLAPFGYWYALMAVYNERSDLQSSYPGAYSHLDSFSGLVSWASAVVSGAWVDHSYANLAPFGYWYDLMSTYNARSDLKGAYPSAYTNFLQFEALVSWAGGVVTRQWSDGAYSSLAGYGYWFALMGTYNQRNDLQTSYPDAYTNFGHYAKLVDWAGQVVTGTVSDPAFLALSNFGYYYDMFNIYDGRNDLLTAFPDAYTNWGAQEALVGWAGEVMDGTILLDPSQPSLQPYGYWFVLVGGVYDQRSDLQTSYPLAVTDDASYQALLQWADEVVTLALLDPAYLTLLPFAITYEALG